MNNTYTHKTEMSQGVTNNKTPSILDSSSQSESLQRKADLANNAAQRAEAPRPNNTGMPDNLKSGIESLSGFSMDDVRVHYNSSKPATVQALAYTQGTDIHVAPGQEKHLPHEAWHVAQQMAGRVSPTTNINGMPVNDNAGLEHEADVMGEMAIQKNTKFLQHPNILDNIKKPIVQKQKYNVTHKVCLNGVKEDTLGYKRDDKGHIKWVWEALGRDPKQYPEDDKEVTIPRLQGVTSIENRTIPSFINDVKTIVHNNKLMGGHLIKHAWGGTQNILNIAVWDGEKAEKIWTNQFEQYIEGHFLTNPEMNAFLEVSVTREKDWCENEGIEGKQQKIVNSLSKNHKIKINDAVEKIPYEVTGNIRWSDGKMKNVEIKADDTGYQDVKIEEDTSLIEEEKRCKEFSLESNILEMWKEADPSKKMKKLTQLITDLKNLYPTLLKDITIPDDPNQFIDVYSEVLKKKHQKGVFIKTFRSLQPEKRSSLIEQIKSRNESQKKQPLINFISNNGLDMLSNYLENSRAAERQKALKNEWAHLFKREFTPDDIFKDAESRKIFGL